MDREFRLEREYSVGEILRYNLRMWWLAIICAAVCALVLGGYKFKANYPFLERELYQNVQQVTANIYVKDYSQESATERVGTVIKIATSKSAYDEMAKKTGMEDTLTYDDYIALFKIIQGEVSDMASIYVYYPAESGQTKIADLGTATAFAEAVLDAAETVSREVLGTDAVVVLDPPFPNDQMEKVETYFITSDEFWKGVLKGATAGALLGIIVEVAAYTFWLLLYKKPKNAEEIRECLRAPIVDDLKEGADDEEAYKRIALFLEGGGSGGSEAGGDENARSLRQNAGLGDGDVGSLSQNAAPGVGGGSGESVGRGQGGCLLVHCISLQSPKRDVASKLAMTYSNEQKRTLFIDLAGEGASSDGSISGYLLDGASAPKPAKLNAYLDRVCRQASEEKGRNLVMNDRFAEYVGRMAAEYERIVISSADITKRADGYAVAKLCDRNLAVCGRKMVTNENMYRFRNGLDVNGIRLDGTLVFER